MRKDIENNVIYASRGYDPETQYGKTVHLQGFQFITKDPWGDFSDEKEVMFKIRHTPEFTHGKLRKNGDIYTIESDDKIQGIAAGQFGVIYDEQARLCLGSGVIV